MTGIYKITNPKGHVYIGKSKNIEKRWYIYRLYLAERQPKLHASFLKYGVSKHKFEVIIECDFNSLHNNESYYIKLYQSHKQLNCAMVHQDNKTRREKVPKSYYWEDRIREYLLRNPVPIDYKKEKKIIAQRKFLARRYKLYKF